MAPGMTLLEAISMASGTTDFANTKKMYILRNEGGKRLKIPVRYKEALKGNQAFDVLLKPDDTIVVPGGGA
jgi:polysaccharide export outer membrane protein